MPRLDIEQDEFLDATGEADTVVETLSREAVPSLEGSDHPLACQPKCNLSPRAGTSGYVNFWLSGRAWSGLVGSGRIWSGLVGSGRVWSVGGGGFSGTGK